MKNSRFQAFNVNTLAQDIAKREELKLAASTYKRILIEITKCAKRGEENAYFSVGRAPISRSITSRLVDLGYSVQETLAPDGHRYTSTFGHAKRDSMGKFYPANKGEK